MDIDPNEPPFGSFLYKLYDQYELGVGESVKAGSGRESIRRYLEQDGFREYCSKLGRDLTHLYPLREHKNGEITQLSERTATGKELSQEIALRIAEIELLQDKLSQSNMEYNTVLVSFSWRITKPLRWLGRKFLGPLFRLKGFRTRRRQHKLIACSELFDRNWYLDRYPDVKAAGADPALHYLYHGAAEGRNPSALFDTEWYLTMNPDVGAAGVNPLAHFEQHGRGEGRVPTPP